MLKRAYRASPIQLTLSDSITRWVSRRHVAICTLLPAWHALSPAGQREHFGPGGSSPGCKVDAEASTVRKRLQQANNVARKRDTGSECRHGCRHLQRLTVIDAIGNRVIVAGAGDAGFRDHQFGPPAAAAN